MKSVLRRPDQSAPPATITYPFLWIDQLCTVWLRTCASCSTGSRDICLQRGKGDFGIGAITECVTRDIDAWPRRIVQGTVLELSNDR
jgi:hypothetical protein